MDNYVIITDSTCDLSQDHVDRMNVYVQPMTFTIKNKEYKNYLDQRELSLDEFYKMLDEGEMAKTAQLNINSVKEFFKPFLEDGKDILSIAFSSGLSGSCNAIRLAIEELLEEYPERKIRLVDSLQASAGEGYLVIEAYNNKKNGMLLDDNADKLEKDKLHIRAWFTVSQLETLRRGGRLSNSAAFAAKLLNIKPVLHVDDEGHLKAVYKKMGRKMAMRQVVSSSIEGYDKNNEHLTIIVHAYCEDEALKLKEMLEEAYKENGITSDIVICKIGPVIGAHCGAGTLAIFTYGDRR